MITLGFNEFLHNIRKNILVIVQMILVYVVCIYAVSIIAEQLKMYNTASEFIDNSGVMITNGRACDMCTTEENALEQLIDKLEAVDNIEYVPYYRGSYEQNAEYEVIMAKDSYRMKLDSGKWCDNGHSKDGEIRAVVCSDTGIHIGDLVTVGEYSYRITGTFSKKEMVYGHLSSHNDANYQMLFNTFDNIKSASAVNEFKNLFVASHEDMEREMSGYYAMWMVIDYDDNISVQDTEYNSRVLADEYDLYLQRDYLNCSDIYEYSKTLITIKVMPVIAAFTVIFILSLISLITTSAVTVSYEKYNYGIYFITGNSWKNTTILALIHWGIEAVVALILAVCGFLIISRIGPLSHTQLSFSIWHVIAIAGIMMIQLFLATIMPYRMLKNMEPIEIFKKAER